MAKFAKIIPIAPFCSLSAIFWDDNIKSNRFFPIPLQPKLMD